jgi:hypothetical protein
MKSTVNTRRNGQAIEVTVTHPFDARVYDVPLTARTAVPAEWTSARVRQGQDTKTFPVLKHERGSYVQYHVKPNAGAVRIEKG